MRTTNKEFGTDRWLRLRLTATRVLGFSALGFSAMLVGFAILLMAEVASAPDSAHETFGSAEEASRALFAAVRSNDEQAITRILRDEGLVSSGDELEDKRDRERFVQKYQQMHRLVREPDGTTVLYIGAENWPFPVPLVSRRGQWFFDPDAGTQEILFRRVGENEATAIETCRALLSASKGDKSQQTSDDPIDQYARNLVSALAAYGRTAAANEESSGPFHGYYIRALAGQGRGSGVSHGTKRGRLFVAYPAEYRSSGVMTFVATPENVVYEKDLGPNTVRIANAIIEWKSDSSWHVAD
jgi:hypothetical protein